MPQVPETGTGAGVGTAASRCFKACQRLPKGANVQWPTDLAPFFHGPHRMTTDTTHQKLLDQLQQLEDELRSQSLWSAVDRKSTRLNSSHLVISYAVFCLTKTPSNCVAKLPDHSRHARALSS